MMFFHIFYTEDVANDESWPRYYSRSKSQESDDGVYIWAVGDHDFDPVKSFNTVDEMFNWCYANGWTKPPEIEF